MADCIEYLGYRTRDGHGGVTQKQLAAECGVEQSTISNIITQRFRKEALNCANQ